MHCPYCLNKLTRVVDSRASNGSVRRRRLCENCEKRFTTYERVEERDIVVVKRDGRREPFKREKLLAGLLKACEKRPVKRERLERFASEVEGKLRSKNKKEVPSRLIGAMVMDGLKAIDEVAYVRFASVYKKFKDAGQFALAVKEAKQARK